MGCGSSSAAKGAVTEPASKVQLKEKSNSRVSNSTEKLQETNPDKAKLDLSPSTSPTVAEGYIQPLPGFAIKLVDADKKIFVNVFHHEKVKSDDILTLPLARVDDKKGEECTAYQVAISTLRFDQTESDPNFKDKIITKILSQLKESQGFNCSSFQIKVPNIKRGYVGENIPLFSISSAPNSTSSNSSIVTSSVDSKRTDRDIVKSVEPEAAKTQAAVEKKIQEQAPTSKKETEKDIPKLAIAETAVVTTPPPQPTTPNAAQDSTKISQPAINEVQTSVDNVIEEVNQEEDDEIPSAFECPPKLQGWVRKQGHVIKNWKMRYFVLNRGYLSYYADKSSNPPFGTNMKGQLCLAGFREKSMYEYSQQSSTQMSGSIAGDDPTAGGGRRSSGFFSSDPQYKINLVYIPGQVGQQHLKKLYPDTDGVPKVKEFVMEAATLDEKYAWLAAISEHTSYLEQCLGNSIYPESTDFTENSVIITTKPATLSMKDGNVNQLPQIAEEMPEHESESAVASPTDETPAPVATTSNKQQSAQYHANIIQELGPNETIVFSGLVGKPNPIGIHLIRQLILIVNNEVTDARPYTKRLLYVDSNTYEKKGDLLWDKKSPNISLKKINASSFDVIQGKAYRFFPKDKVTVDRWIEVINSGHI